VVRQRHAGGGRRVLLPAGRSLSHELPDAALLGARATLPSAMLVQDGALRLVGAPWRRGRREASGAATALQQETVCCVSITVVMTWRWDVENTYSISAAIWPLQSIRLHKHCAM
jgi:hypothetical protein